MPNLRDETDAWDVAALFRTRSETLALIFEGAEHPYGYSLALREERPTALSKGEAWE